MKKLIIISSSLNPDSKTFLGVKKVEEVALKKDFYTQFIDLRDIDMPFCDGRDFGKYPKTLKDIAKKLEETDYIIFGTPIYCYSLSGVLKNFIDIFGKFMERKKFGILEQAGSKSSYLASADLQKILGYECESQPIFPVVITDYSSYSNGELIDEKAIKKIEIMLGNISK